MDEEVDRDEDGACQLDEQQAGSSAPTAVTELAAATSAQSHGCSHYEPHYQQMHPSLIYYDEQAYLHHHHLHHHHSHLTNHNHSMATAAAVVAVASGNNLTNQHHQWEHHQDHFVHMPIMIPFGDTTNLNSFSATPRDEQTLNGNEPVVVSPSSRLRAATPMVERKATDWPKTTEEYEDNRQAGIVQSRELTTDESFGCAENLSTPTNRELHNEIERRRRSRIKHCCEVLRTLVPGLTEKTDKATVLEHTVNFVAHLVRDCQASKCNCVVNFDQ